jgi:hypothetical protein
LERKKDFRNIRLSLQPPICSMKLFNIFGLLLNLIGAVMMFYSNPVHSKRISFHEEDELKSILKKETKDRKNLKFGLLLMCLGFTIQLAASILEHSMTK